MKKFLGIMMVAAMLMGSFAGCAGKSNDAGNSTQAPAPAKTEGQKEKTGDATASKKIKINIAHGVAETHPANKGWMEFAKVLEESGKYEVSIFPNAQMGGDTQVGEGVQLGNITAGHTTPSPTAAFDKLFNALEIPFLFSSDEQANEVLDGPVGQELLDSLEEYKLHGLGYMGIGFRNLTTSSKSVKTPEDLKGLKVRTMENEIQLKTWKALGANPTPIAFSELFTALQQKTVDGQENPWSVIYSSKISEAQKYATETQHLYTPLVMIINLDFWNSLSDDDKALFEKAADAAKKVQRSLKAADDKDSIEKIQETTEITFLTDEERAAFKKLTTPVIDDIRALAGDDIVDKILAATSK